MVRVTTPDGSDLGDIEDSDLLAYYRGEGCTIGDDVQSPAETSSVELDLDPAADERTEDETSDESGTPSA
jgi:hypothetical protein